MVEPLNTKAWVMVPVEPTPEMVEAHYQAHAEAETVFADAQFVWAKMLSASPALPAVDGGEAVALLRQRDGEEFDGEVHLTSAEAVSIAALLTTQQQQIAALMNERTNLIETKREQIDRLTKDKREAAMLALSADGQAQEACEKLTAAESRALSLEEALRKIAEGNLGDDPWQANYDRIRNVARNALKVNGND